VLSPVVYQEKISKCLDLLLDHCLTAASSTEIDGRFNKLKAAMDILNYLFYEEFDAPNGAVGSFTLK